MISGYVDDIVDYILKNNNDFEYAMENQIRFGYERYSINIVKSEYGYRVFVYHKSESIHSIIIDKNTYRYDEIKTFVDTFLIKFDKEVENEQLLVKLLGKNNRKNKFDKIIDKMNDVQN